jgi:hypothetical protein
MERKERGQRAQHDERNRRHRLQRRRAGTPTGNLRSLSTGSSASARRHEKHCHFTGCILAIPVLARPGRFAAAAILAVLVLGEVVVVLWLNQWSCPLTAVAARYTDDRRANFDIYLPEWLARYNKEIFGPLYLAGVVYAMARYLGVA